MSSGTRQRSGRLEAGSRVRADVLLRGASLRQDRDTRLQRVRTEASVCTREFPLKSQPRHDHPPPTHNAAPSSRRATATAPAVLCLGRPRSSRARAREGSASGGQIEAARGPAPDGQGRQPPCGGLDAAQTMRRAARALSAPSPLPPPAPPSSPCPILASMDSGGRGGRAGKGTHSLSRRKRAHPAPPPVCASGPAPGTRGRAGVSYSCSERRCTSRLL